MNAIFGRYWVSYAILLALVVVEVIAAYLISRAYLPAEPRGMFQFGGLSMAAMLWYMLPLFWLGTIAVQLPLRQTQRPTVTLLRAIRRRKSWLIRGLLLTTLLVPMSHAFSAIKSAIPDMNPFWMDPLFADIDRFILGRDAWQITRTVFGDYSTIFFDRAYMIWGTFIFLISGWLAFTRNARLQIVGSLSFNLTWFVLGNVGAIALSSSGPCFFDVFYDSDRFAALNADIDRITQQHFLFSKFAMNYLIQNLGSTGFGAGISAMPSLHVGTTFLGALAIGRFTDNLILRFASSMYVIVIFVGSFHLGWHYFIDGIVAMAGVWMIWRFVEWFVDRVSVGDGIDQEATVPI